jgi:hypothetical protein
MDARTMLRPAAAAVAIGVMVLGSPAYLAGGVAHAAWNNTEVGLVETTAPIRPDRVMPAYKVTGHAKTGAAGTSTGAECRGYADAANGLVDQSNENDKNHVNNQMVYEMYDSIIKAGAARVHLPASKLSHDRR